MRYFSSPFYLAVVAFVVAVAYVPGLFSAPFMPRWWAIAIGVPLLCDLRSFSGDAKLPALTAMALIWAATAVILSDYPFGGIFPFILLLLTAGVAWAANSSDDLDFPLAAFGWGVAVSSVLAIAQWLGWDALPFNGLPGGLFFSSEVLAETAGPIFVWAVVSRRWTQSRRWTLAALMAVPIILGHSRVATFAVFIALIYAWRPSSRWAKPLVCMALAVACLIALTTLGDAKSNSAFTRAILWGAALESITPLGRGLGWWASAHPFGFEEFVHSDALQFLVECGLGGLLFIAIPAVIFWNGIADKAYGACFVAVCIEGLLSFPLHVPSAAFVFALLAGHLARQRGRVLLPERQSRADRDLYLRRQSASGPGMARGRAGHGGRVWDRPAHPDDPRPDPAGRGDSVARPGAA